MIRSLTRPDIEHDAVEAVWIELRTKVSAILTEVVYRPPNASASLTKGMWCV